MKLEELIYKRFTDCKELTKYLTTYSGLPAVFSPEAPEENQPGWGRHTQYPKIIYNFDMQANEERSSVGTLSVSLFCLNTIDIVPEDIELEVKKCLKDVLLKPDGGTPYCFTWSRTDAFTIQEKKNDLIIGSDIRFDILEYPCQQTTDPDPIIAANQYMKELYPECIVIGIDRMEEITEAAKECPVIYCRLVSVDKSKETNTVAWMDGKIAVHILCPDSEKRMKIAAAITNRLSLDGEIIMLDKSPMFIQGLQVNYKSDYLKDGQILMTGHYGLLRYKSKQHTIRKINVGH